MHIPWKWIKDHKIFWISRRKTLSLGGKNGTSFGANIIPVGVLTLRKSQPIPEIRENKKICIDISGLGLIYRHLKPFCYVYILSGSSN